MRVRVCPTCGHENAWSEDTCVLCATPLQDAPVTDDTGPRLWRRCPHCGQRISFTVRTCTHCGHPVRDTSTQQKEAPAPTPNSQPTLHAFATLNDDGTRPIASPDVAHQTTGSEDAEEDAETESRTQPMPPTEPPAEAPTVLVATDFSEAPTGAVTPSTSSEPTETTPTAPEPEPLTVPAASAPSPAETVHTAPVSAVPPVPAASLPSRRTGYWRWALVGVGIAALIGAILGAWTGPVRSADGGPAPDDRTIPVTWQDFTIEHTDTTTQTADVRSTEPTGSPLRGTVRLIVEPLADVYVNGYWIGRVRSRQLNLPEGTYRIRVAWPLWIPRSEAMPLQERIVRVRTDHPVELAFQLRGQGWLYINSWPWSDVRIDGKSFGSTPLTVRLPAGVHEVRWQTPDGRTYTVSVTVPENARVHIGYDFTTNSLTQYPNPETRGGG